MTESLLAIVVGLALASAYVPDILIVTLFAVVVGVAQLATSGWSRRRP